MTYSTLQNVHNHKHYCVLSGLSVTDERKAEYKREVDKSDTHFVKKWLIYIFNLPKIQPSSKSAFRFAQLVEHCSNNHLKIGGYISLGSPLFIVRLNYTQVDSSKARWLHLKYHSKGRSKECTDFHL